MPAVLVTIISYALGSFVLRFFVTLGIGLFTYKGLSTLIEEMLDLISPMISTLPASLLDILALCGAPEALSIVTSAVLTRAAIKSASVFVGVTT